MKKRTVKTKTAELVNLCGGGGDGRKEAALRIGVALSYIYRLEHGKLKPGKRLYVDIVRLCAELEAENK